MVSAVLRDELLLGVYITAGVDKLTKLALTRLGVQDCSLFLRGAFVSVANIGFIYSSGSLSLTLPGFLYGTVLQIMELKNIYLELKHLKEDYLIEEEPKKSI